MKINSINNFTPFKGYLLVKVDSKERGVVSQHKTIDTNDIVEFSRLHDVNYITVSNGETYKMTAPLGKGNKYYQELLNAYTAASQSDKIAIEVK